MHLKAAVSFILNYLKIEDFSLSDSQLSHISSPSLPDADILYIPNFFTRSVADSLEDALVQEIPFSGATIKLFGKEISIPRLQSWHGDDGIQYTYSGKTLRSKPWTTNLSILKQQIEEAFRLKFNAVLCNLYRNGTDSMGWHSDDEKELGHHPFIVSVSFGAERRFCLQHKKKKELKWQQVLEHGSILIIAGDTQHYWRHQLPKQPKCLDRRINLTFRQVI